MSGRKLWCPWGWQSSLVLKFCSTWAVLWNEDRVRIPGESGQRYYRPTEVDLLKGHYSKARRVLSWEPKIWFAELVKLMVDADIKLLKDHREGRIKVAG